MTNMASASSEIVLYATAACAGWQSVRPNNSTAAVFVSPERATPSPAFRRDVPAVGEARREGGQPSRTENSSSRLLKMSSTSTAESDTSSTGIQNSTRPSSSQSCPQAQFEESFLSPASTWASPLQGSASTLTTASTLPPPAPWAPGVVWTQTAAGIPAPPDSVSGCSFTRQFPLRCRPPVCVPPPSSVRAADLRPSQGSGGVDAQRTERNNNCGATPASEMDSAVEDSGRPHLGLNQSESPPSKLSLLFLPPALNSDGSTWRGQCAEVRHPQEPAGGTPAASDSSLSGSRRASYGSTPELSWQLPSAGSPAQPAPSSRLLSGSLLHEDGECPCVPKSAIPSVACDTRAPDASGGGRVQSVPYCRTAWLG